MSRNVTLIIGPPGSGKSTWAHNSGLHHLEREHYPNDQTFKDAAQRHATQPNATIAICRCCPTLEEQHEWENLVDPTNIIILDIPFDECARRIHKRHRGNWRGEIAAARAWHESRERVISRTSRTW